MKSVYFSLGINPAGTTLVATTVQPRRIGGGIAPEFLLSELERKSEEPQAVVGEMILRLLRIHYPAEFVQYAALTPPKPPLPDDDKIVALAPLEHSGRMRDPRIAVGICYGQPVTLHITTMTGTVPTGEAGQDIVLDGLAEFPTPQEAWYALGHVVLHRLATLHPDVLASFPRLVSGRP